MSSIQMMNRIELETFIKELKKKTVQLKQQIQELEAGRQESIERGDADSAIASKKEVRTCQEEIEAIDIRLEAAQRRLDKLRANEPEAAKIGAQIAKLWEEVKGHLEALDQAGETIRTHFHAIENVNDVLFQLASKHMTLIGENPVPPKLSIWDRVPEFLTDHPPKKLSEYILQRPWRPWIYRPESERGKPSSQ